MNEKYKDFLEELRVDEEKQALLLKALEDFKQYNGGKSIVEVTEEKAKQAFNDFLNFRK
ncbi:hypothetical protein [Lysinibacillus sp. RC79]|uniref:hypothetical protein n=1 Tax=Lysinibacillus sp. RC79 TaxID=3156296 RepID=UPI0035164EED